MKTQSLKTVVNKEIFIIVIALLLGIAGTAFAGGESEKSKKALSKAQTELFNEIDQEYQKNLEAILGEVEHPSVKFDSVEVYTLGGELIKTIQVNNEKPLSEIDLPPHAKLLTIDDRTAVYVVF